jgi:2TM domain
MLIRVRETPTTGFMNYNTDPERADERAQSRRDAIAFTLSGPLVTAILVLVWALAGGGYFWPLWPMLGMSIALLVALWRAFGPIPGAQTVAGPDARPSRRR